MGQPSHAPGARDVLVVDANAKDRDAAAELLRANGIVVIACSNVSEIVPAMEASPSIGMVLLGCDIDSKQLGAVLGAIRRKQSGLRVVGCGSAGHRDEVSRAGVADFLHKPWDFRTLIDTLSRRLDQCVTCSIALPLRTAAPFESALRWACRFCGERYLGVWADDANEESRQNVLALSIA